MLDSVEAIIESFKEGVGFTLLPEPDVIRFADDKVLIIEPEDACLNRQLALVTLPDGPMVSNTDALKGLLFD